MDIFTSYEMSKIDIGKDFCEKRMVKWHYYHNRAKMLFIINNLLRYIFYKKNEFYLGIFFVRFIINGNKKMPKRDEKICM